MNPNAMLPHGLALLAYFQGESAARLVIRRDDGFEDRLPVSHFFRPPAEFSPIEVAALERCRGHVLDVGAGTGLHSLFLQSRGQTVTPVDISPQSVTIMHRRGLTRARCIDILEYEGPPVDTLLLLGHGIGMVEDLTGLRRFLDHARNLIRRDGQLLMHSLDVRRTRDPKHRAYHGANRSAGRYVGAIRLCFEYAGQVGPTFGWLHVDPATLRKESETAGWGLEIVLEEESGEYLGRLAPLPGRG